jgi:hypothetical protein
MTNDSKSLKTLKILKSIQGKITENDIRQNLAAFCINDSLNTRISMITDTLGDKDDTFPLSETLGSLIEILILECEDGTFDESAKKYAEKYIDIMQQILKENS